MKKKKEQNSIINIEELKSPNDIKNFSYSSLNNLSNILKKEILEAVSNNGGHLSSNLGVIDATISLCYSFDFEKDKIIFDVGHQTYAYKLLTGRNLSNLRKKNGISGFQKMVESKYDHFECGHSSTSISAAIGMASARDLKKENYEVIAFIGDGSLMNGLALEGLNLGGSNGHKIIIVVNDNEMSISKPVGALAKMFRKFSTSTFYLNSKKTYKKVMFKTKFGISFYKFTLRIKNWLKSRLLKLNLFDYFGYKFIGPVDGHNIKAMNAAFNKAKKIDKSCVVYLKTIKGKGYAKAENDKNGKWHGVTPFDLNNVKTDNPKKDFTWPSLYEKLLLKEMQVNENIFCIVPATGSGSQLLPIFETIPNRIVDVGINEEHAFTMAAGLSISGFHPIISIYSTFLQRGYDEINHDLARLNCNCTILIDRAGLVGPDGETHQGIFDQSILYPIPNTTISLASNKKEAEHLLKESLKPHKVFCIRYPNLVFNSVDEHSEELKYGDWLTLKDISLENKNVAIVSFGPIINEYLDLIQKENLDVALINALYQKPLNEDYINKLLKFDNIVLIDAYSTKDGFINNMINKLNSLHYKGRIIYKAISNEFISQATVEEQLESQGLLPKQIIALIKSIIK